MPSTSSSTPRTALRRLAGVILTVLAIPAFAQAAQAAPSGVLWGSGYGEYGELGNGPNAPEDLFVPQGLAAPTGVSAVSSDYYATLALLSNGTVEGWGANDVGQLGDGTKVEHQTPEVIPGLSGVSQVSAGFEHSMALLSNGEVLAWGSNKYGELGNGGVGTESLTPVHVPGLTGVSQIAAGCYTDYAVLANGTVEDWGWGTYGELGNGGTSEQTTPAVIPGLSEVAAISAGCYDAVALLRNGTVKSWGWDEYGEVGNGESGKSLIVDTPVLLGLTGVAQVGSGQESSEALLSNGTVYGWGHNEYAELGDGTLNEHDTPEQVPGVSGVAQIAVGGYFTLARLANGSVEGWGYNGDGELGDLTGQERETHEKLSYPAAAIGLESGDGYSYTAFVIEGALGSVSGGGTAFATTPAGANSAAQGVVLTNSGPAALAVSGDTLAGTGAGAFRKLSDGCQGATLAAGASCTVTYSFSPSAVGSYAATLTFASSAAQPIPAATLSGTAVAKVPPVISSLKLSANAFAAARSGPSAIAAAADGAYVLYRDTQAATSTFTVQQAARGAVKGVGKSRRCGAAPKRPGRGSVRCTYYRSLGSFTHADAAGLNAVLFTGRAGGRALARGTYRLSVTAVSAEGASTPRTAAFTITR